MSSAPAAERPAGSGSVLRGFVAGACVGAFVGLLDVARALGSPNDMLQATDAPAVLLLYAALFAPAGAVAGLLARRFDWPHRMRNLLVAIGAGWFFVVAWANVGWLPGLTAGTSLAFDAAMLVVALVLLVVRYRAPGEDLAHTRRWLLLGVASAGLAFLLPVLAAPRDDGPAPDAAHAPSGDAGARRPNVLVYLVDTLRADHLGCYGYGKPTSPELDAFAADAIRFEDCRATSSWTKPSVASLLTSSYPSTHACVELRETLVPEAETLAEVFRAAGWRTGAFVDNPFVSAEFGFAQGFERFDEARPSVLAMGTLLGKAFYAAGIVSVTGHANALGGRRERGAAHLHDSLLRWVDETPDRPWFAYVQAMEPHEPYRPAREDAEAFGFPKGEDYAVTPPHGGLLPFHVHPKPDDALRGKLVAQYDGEIRGWSRHFGKLVEELRARGRLADTVVVFVSDHGEEFHEHGGWTHGHSLHRELTQVPLVVRLPDTFGDVAVRGRGRVVQGTATLLDVAPTLLELCRVRYPQGDEPGRPGESLVPQLLGERGRPSAENVPGNRRILAEVTQQQAKLRSMKDGRWLLIHAEEPFREATQLFDDVGDPRHRRDRAEDHTLEVRDLGARMRDFFRQLEAIALTGRSREIDPETLEALRGLGYVK